MRTILLLLILICATPLISTADTGGSRYQVLDIAPGDSESTALSKIKLHLPGAELDRHMIGYTGSDAKPHRIEVGLLASNVYAPGVEGQESHIGINPFTKQVISVSRDMAFNEVDKRIPQDQMLKNLVKKYGKFAFSKKHDEYTEYVWADGLDDLNPMELEWLRQKVANPNILLTDVTKIQYRFRYPKKKGIVDIYPNFRKSSHDILYINMSVEDGLVSDLQAVSVDIDAAYTTSIKLHDFLKDEQEKSAQHFLIRMFVQDGMVFSLQPVSMDDKDTADPFATTH